jgi:hypothetical protein
VSIRVRRDQKRCWFVARAAGRLTLHEVLRFVQTVRAAPEDRMWPLLFDARSATTDATDADVDRAVAAVQQAVQTGGRRGHVAIIADDDRLFGLMLLYEARCAAIGVRVIRVFRQLADAERWLEIVSAARYFQQP